MRHRKRYGCLAMALTMGVLSFAWPAAAASWLKPSIPNVAVQDQDGHDYQFYSELLQGRRVLIDFIYTSCKTVCPTQTAVLREVRDQLSRNGSDERDVLLISVTLDPQHDSPSQLRRYAAQFGIEPGLEQGWIFLTGSASDVKKLLAAFDNTTGRASDHNNVFWIGNEPERRWTRTAAFSEPQHVTDLLQLVSR